MKTLTVFMRAAFIFFALSSAALNAGEKISIAVLEFENNSGSKNMEHLKKGIRDMITTDIACVNDVVIVERARINQVLKEINFSKSEYFDKENSVKIGKLAGASFLLTGSYLFNEKNIRIDVRLIQVSSGVIVYTEKVQGKQEDFFDLEKILVSAIVKKMKPNITNRELRRVNQLQTESYATFDKYSQAIDLEEQGKLVEAIELLQKASKDDKSFKMAQEKLSSFQQSLAKRIAEQTKKDITAEKDLKSILDSDFEKCKARIKVQDHSCAYYLSLLSLAVHYGLRSDFQKERDYLLQYWKEFSEEPDAVKIWNDLVKDLEKKSLQWEKWLMGSDGSQNQRFSDAAKKWFTYPRFANIWPFCQHFSIVYPYSLKNRRSIATHQFLPHELFSYQHNRFANTGLNLHDYYSRSAEPRELPIPGTPRIEIKILTPLEHLETEVSIAVFYIKHDDIKIPENDFDSIISWIRSLLDDCSPYISDDNYTRDRILALLKKMVLISSHIKDRNSKIKIDKFILLLTKFLKGEAPGDINADGITISKTFFEGKNMAIISFLPQHFPFRFPDYSKCLIIAMQSFNPNGRFYIATEKLVFSDSFVPATKDNVVGSIAFLKKNIYCFVNSDTIYSIDQRLIDAYIKAPADEDTHIIVFLSSSGQLVSQSKIQIPYYFKDQPKKVRISIVVTEGEIDIDQLRQSYKNDNYDYDSLLKNSVYSGGEIYVNDTKKTIFNKSIVAKWFDDLKER